MASCNRKTTGSAWLRFISMLFVLTHWCIIQKEQVIQKCIKPSIYSHSLMLHILPYFPSQYLFTIGVQPLFF